MPAYKERAPGTYRAVFRGIDTDFRLTDQKSGEEVIRWKWTWQEVSDPTTVGELDTITSPGFRPRSNGLKLFTGMLGRAPAEGDDTDTLVGQEFDVVYGPNQNGRYTVTNALPVQAVAAAAPAAAVPTPAGDLPF